MKTHRLINALLRQPVDKTPIWIMRQAGRYLPEYRALREKAGSFLALCTNPELACEVTLQPLRRFPLDAAILFSDILTIPHAMGLGLEFAQGEGPIFKHPIKSAQDIKNLPIPDPEQELKYVPDTIRLLKKELQDKTPLIGFAGSPWTIATYMVEGQSSKTFSKIKKMLYATPELLHELLNKLIQSITLYLNAQIAAGADVVMLFDTWGSALTPQAYREFSLLPMQKIIAGLNTMMGNKKIPVILFSKQANHSLQEIAASGCDAAGIDWTIDIAEAKSLVQGKIALQGNLDPSILYADVETVKNSAIQILENYGRTPGHVFNLGHGIYPDIPIENVEILVETVHGWR